MGERASELAPRTPRLMLLCHGVWPRVQQPPPLLQNPGSSGPVMLLSPLPRKSLRKPAIPLPEQCLRFRTRRFMKHVEVFAVDQAVTQVQVDQRNASGSIGSCEMRRNSTKDLVHSWRTSKRDLYPNHTFQAAIEPGNWFAAEQRRPGEFTLVGCTVAPGFEYEDMEIAGRAELKPRFPEHREIIEKLTRA